MANLAICLLTRILVICIILFAHTANAQSAAESVYENVKDSIGTIFSINEENKKDSALGSGVAIAKDLVATNCHVALAGNFMFVDINGETLLGKLFYYNQKKDLCLLQINGMPLKPVIIRPSSSVKIGEDVFAIGNPEGQMKTISKGIISNKTKEDGIELLQTDASISHGSSGGGLFDVEGRLIGITTKTLKEGENIAFAIPTELILSVIDSKEKTSDTTSQIDSKNSNASSSETSATSKTTHTEEFNKLEHIGYYGEDEIALMKWNNKCFIGITGRYRDKPTSLAIWFPHKPDGLFIFSRVVNAEKATKYFNWVNEKENIQYPESKSFLYFDKKLYPLSIMVVDNVKQPVYLFVLSREITEELIELDDFLGQFYGYTQSGGMTTVKFGLTGFTEAFGAYSKYCK